MSDPTVAEPTVVMPDHKQLPDQDGEIVNNYQEHPQSALLTAILTPRLREVQPDGQFSIAANSGIYWRYTQPPLAGCKAPDWFCVLGVPPLLTGELRRSYVLWQEGVAPLLVVEYVSGDGAEEHDTTPQTGKFWVYERSIRAGYYVIFDGFRGTLEVYRLTGDRFQVIEPNERGRYAIEPLQVELGLWQGEYWVQPATWVRAWDLTSGELLPTGDELAERERMRAEQERDRAETAEELLDDARQRLEEETERAETERHRADATAQQNARLIEKLRALGIDPEAS